MDRRKLTTISGGLYALSFLLPVAGEALGVMRF